jgi:hypothetical protein
LCGGGKCVEKKEGGDSCEADNECASASCSEGKCTGRKAAGEDCEAADDCDSGKCEQGKCATSKLGRPALHRIWVGLTLQGDWFVMPSSLNVCVAPTGPNVDPNPTVKPGTAGYTCIDPNSSAPFPQVGDVRNSQITSRFDQVQAGFAFGNLRILASVDYALNANMMAGLRGGYVLFTNPATSGPGAAFAPLHVEARFTYVLGKRALISQTISPIVFAALGIGEFDAYVPVRVEANRPPANADQRCPASSPGTDSCATENAWLTAGPVFVAGGAGVRVMLAPAIAGTVAGKVEAAFGGTAGTLIGLAPELGVQYGF